MRGHEGQRMLAHEVLLDGLVRAGGQERGLGQQLDLQRHQVAEDARQRDHHVDPRPAEFGQRDQLRAGQAAVAVEARPGADQGQGLGDRCPLGLEVVGAPQHDGDGLGEGMAVRHVALDQAFGLARAVLHRIGAGDAEGVEAVQVAPGGQDLRRAQQVAARGGPHEAAVQRAQQAIDLVVLGHQAVDVLQPREERRQRLVVGSCTRCGQRSRHALAGHQRLDRRPLRPLAVRGVGHRQQQVDPLDGRGGAADDVQAVGDQRVLDLEHGVRSAAPPARRPRRPRRARPQPVRARRPRPG